LPREREVFGGIDRVTPITVGHISCVLLTGARLASAECTSGPPAQGVDNRQRGLICIDRR
jgi:hypothetical protein